MSLPRHDSAGTLAELEDAPSRGGYAAVEPLPDFPGVPPAFEQSDFTYLSINDSDARRGLYVTRWGQDCYRPGESYPHPARPQSCDCSWNEGRVLSDYSVILLLEGEGDFEDRIMGRVAWNAGEVLLLAPGEWHRYRSSRRAGWREIWCNLNGEYLHSLQARGIYPRTALLRRLCDASGLLQAMRRLHAHAAKNSLMVESFALETLAQALESPATGHRGCDLAVTTDVLVDRALEHIWMNCDRPITVADLAKALCVTRRTLERRFHGAHQRSIAHEIARCRIQKARILLSGSRMSIKEVSHASGFGSSRRLLRTFQRHFGQSPSAFQHGTDPLEAAVRSLGGQTGGER